MTGWNELLAFGQILMFYTQVTVTENFARFFMIY
jgi:hypothetical protein